MYKNTSDLIAYVNNARTHSDEQVLQICASIKEFGFTNPILTDGDNGIIAGHGRVMAAKKIGMEEVPTIELSHLSEAQKKAYIIADNKLALNSGWDDAMLAIEFSELENALQEEKDRTRGGGYDRSVFICPACKNKKSSREHKALKGKCSKQLQQKYFNEGGE